MANQNHTFPVPKVETEDYVWTGLAAFTLWMISGWWQWSLWMTLAQCCLLLFHRPNVGGKISGNNKQFVGKAMVIVLVPTLLHAMSKYSGKVKGDDDNGNENSINWQLFATLTTFPPSVDLLLLPIMIGLSALRITWFTATSWYYVAVAILIDSVLNSGLSNSFSTSELQCVAMILAVFILHLPNSSGDWDNSTSTTSSLYGLIAAYGFFGCCFTCLISCYIAKSWWMRIGINVVGPLLFIEGMLMKQGFDAQAFEFPAPLSIKWLIQFLMEPESGYPRLYGLVYWGVTLVLASIPTYALVRISSSNNIPVVVTRKWFHLIAVLLFAPVIWKAPQLMSLSFAIATCVLLVLETIRRDIPAVQTFYVTFIDDAKDRETEIIVSHIFLIVGCAAPLWINEVLQSSGGRSYLLLAEFGVLCIGIGDAMGAVVGKGIGKHKWGQNNRTLEGSAAMWLSMVVAGAFCCYSFWDYIALIAATSFVTVLEAFTNHLDNLVLPLAGTTILLLLL